MASKPFDPEVSETINADWEFTASLKKSGKEVTTTEDYDNLQLQLDSNRDDINTNDSDLNGVTANVATNISDIDALQIDVTRYVKRNENETISGNHDFVGGITKDGVEVASLDELDVVDQKVNQNTTDIDTNTLDISTNTTAAQVNNDAIAVQQLEIDKKLQGDVEEVIDADWQFGTTNHLVFTGGTTVERSNLNFQGAFRYNKTIREFEYNNGILWQPISVGTGGTDKITFVDTAEFEAYINLGGNNVVLEGGQVLITDAGDIHKGLWITNKVIDNITFPIWNFADAIARGDISAINTDVFDPSLDYNFTGDCEFAGTSFTRNGVAVATVNDVETEAVLLRTATALVQTNLDNEGIRLDLVDTGLRNDIDDEIADRLAENIVIRNEFNTRDKVMVKAQFDAHAKKVIGDSAGSGSFEWGKQQNSLAVNEGMWTSSFNEFYQTALWLGKESSAVGVSRTSYPIFIVNGVTQAIRQVGSATNDYNRIAFPDAPDGTKTYDSDSGVVTEHASAAEAFEGLVTNGDFRSGDITGWNSNGTILTVANGAASSTLNQGDAIGTDETTFNENLVAGIVYVWEATITVPDGLVGEISHFESTEGTTSTSFTGTGKPQTVSVKFNSVNTNPNANSFSIKHLSATPTLYVVHSGSLLPETESVITSRKDYVLLESWHEIISSDGGLDGNMDAVFPLGNVQYGGQYEGIPLSTSNSPQGYSAFGEWDSATTGNSIQWSIATDAQKLVFVSDPDNNIYLDGDDLIQVRYRIRVLEGRGDAWDKVSPNGAGISDFLLYDNNSRPYVRGSNTSVTDYTGGTGVFANDNLDPITLLGNGLWGMRDTGSNAGKAHNGLCFAVPIALVQRRNQGAYVPSLNSNGCAAIQEDGGGDSTAKVWHDSLAYKPNSIAETFDKASTFRDGSITSGTLSRIDEKFYDAIYASDVEDLRMSSRRVPVKELREHYKRKAIAGEVRGQDAVPFLRNIESATTQSTSTAYAVKSVDITGDFSWLSNSNSAPTTVIGSIIVDGVAHSIYGAAYNSGQLFVFSRTLPSTGYGTTGHTLDLGISELRLHTQANPTWTDLIGDPVNIAATFPNGVEGQWVPLLPTDSESLAFPFNRKNIQGNYGREFTLDNGLSWTSNTGSTIDSTNNTTTTTFPDDLYVALLHYETQAHFTEDDVNSEVLDLGGHTSGNRHNADLGNILTSSLIGKVATSSHTDGRPKESGVYGYTIDTVLRTDVNPEHRGLISANTNDSPAVKTLDYLSEQDGVGKLVYAYKEMMYGTDVTTSISGEISNLYTQGIPYRVIAGRFSGRLVIVNSGDRTTKLDDFYLNITTGEFVSFDTNQPIGIVLWDGNGWGDNNQFEIVNNQESYTDLNGQVGVVGHASFPIQFFIDRSSGAL